MKKEFKIIDLIDIFIEKIIYFFLLLILVIVLSWYLNTLNKSKYILNHISFHENYNKQINLQKLANLKFYTGFNDSIKAYEANKFMFKNNEKHISSYLSDRFGVMQDLKLIFLNKIKNKKIDEKISNDIYFDYVFQNIRFSYNRDFRGFDIFIDYETKNAEEIIYLKNALIEYLELANEILKKDFINSLKNLNQLHEKKLFDDELIIKKFIDNYLIIIKNDELNQDDNVVNEIIAKLYSTLILLEETKRQITINRQFIKKLENNMDFELINTRFNSDSVYVMEDTIQSETIYLSLIAFATLIYLIILLLMLAYRNK